MASGSNRDAERNGNDTMRVITALLLLLPSLLFAASGGMPFGARMPFGIPPLPQFSTQAVANVYGDANHYTYWIDQTHASATDAANPNGSPSTPRLTIPNPMVLTAGDVVQIRGTNYGLALIDVQATGGTVTAPIFITGGAFYPATTNLTYIGQLKFRDYSASNVVVEGLHVTGLMSAASGIPIHSICFRYNKWVMTGTDADGGSDAAAFAISSDIGGGFITVHSIVVLSNYVDHFGSYLGALEGDLSGIYVGNNSTNIWGIGNKFWRTSGDGIAGGANAANTSHHLYYGFNDIGWCRENAIDKKAVSDVIISENYLHDIHPPPVNITAGGEAVVLHEQNKTNTWVIFNTIANSECGVWTKDHYLSYVIGNVFSNIYWVSNVSQPTFDVSNSDMNGAAVRIGTIGGTVSHNTFFKCDIGIQNNGFGLILDNNLMANSPRTNFLGVITTDTTSAFSNNLIYATSGVPVLNWRGTAGSVATVEAAFSSQVGSNLTSNPQLSNAPLTVVLLNTSPAIDAARVVGAYADFFARYGRSISNDFYNVSRPINAWDIGAYESGTNESPSPVASRIGISGRAGAGTGRMGL